MSIIKLFKDVYSLTNYDFSNVRDHLIVAIDAARATSYKDFGAELKIERKSEQVENLSIRFFILKKDESYSTISDSQDFYLFKNLPMFVSDSLIEKKKYEVDLSREDLEEIYANRHLPINTSNKDLTSIISEKLRRTGVNNLGGLSAEIIDTAIYYTVRVYSNSKEPLAKFLTLTVEGLEYQYIEQLDAYHRVTINL